VRSPESVLREIRQNESLSSAYVLNTRQEAFGYDLSLFCKRNNLYVGTGKRFFDENWLLVWYMQPEKVPEYSLKTITDFQWALALLRDCLKKGIVAVEAFPGAEQWLTEVYGGALVSSKNGNYLFFSGYQNLLQMASERLLYRDDFPKTTLFFREPPDRIVEVKNAYKFIQTEIKTDTAYHSKYQRFSEKAASDMLDSPVFFSDITGLVFANRFHLKEEILEWFIIPAGEKNLDAFVQLVSPSTDLVLFQSNGSDWNMTIALSEYVGEYGQMFESWGIDIESVLETTDPITLVEDSLFLFVSEKRLCFSNTAELPVFSLTAEVKEELQRAISDTKTYSVTYSLTRQEGRVQHEVRSIRHENNLSVETVRAF
jgi:hypothetical protein